MRGPVTPSALVLVAATIAVATQPAAAQTAAPSPPSTGHLVVEPIESGFVIAPDARFAEINDRFATFGGVSGGWITERTLMIGGAGYWLANRDDDFKMAYGGPVIEVLIRGDKRIGFGARGLVGGGTATIGVRLDNLLERSLDLEHLTGIRGIETLLNGIPGLTAIPGLATFVGSGNLRDIRFGTVNVLDRVPSLRVPLHEDYFIAEPQGNVFWNVTRHVRINGGFGYRLIAGARFLGKDIDGPSGSVSVQISGW